MATMANIPMPGTDVELIQKPIAGKVLGIRTTADGTSVEILVRYTNDEGDDHERWFDYSQLAVVEPKGE